MTTTRNPRLTDNDARKDFHKALQAMRDTLASLREDYSYLEVRTADDDLVKAIDAFDQRIAQEIDRHEEELVRAGTRMEAASCNETSQARIDRRVLFHVSLHGSSYGALVKPS